MTKPIILNTRPASLQESTDDAFKKYGIETISMPCIEITSVTNSKQVMNQLQDIKAHDTLIFSSQYAVKYAYRLDTEFSISDSSLVISVGTKTAHILEHYYSGHIWIPQSQNSEGVINLLKGLASCQSIKLITAANGRNLIQNYAKENSIKCEQINVYQRQLPAIDNDTIKFLEQTDKFYILATSETTLVNLKLLASDLWNHILEQTVLCASDRIKNKAIELGFKDCRNMHTANPDKIAQQLN